MTSLRFVLLTLLLLGCAGPDSASGPATTGLVEGDEPGSTRASREQIAVRVGETSSVAPLPAAVAIPRPLLRVHAIDVSEGEDGDGRTIVASGPVAFDLDARRFPPRASDPVLHVGALRFIHYVHPSPKVLRFVAADATRLTMGVRVFVEYDEDPTTRVIVAEALELP